jgi:hypothetical protein
MRSQSGSGRDHVRDLASARSSSFVMLNSARFTTRRCASNLSVRLTLSYFTRRRAGFACRQAAFSAARVRPEHGIAIDSLRSAAEKLGARRAAASLCAVRVCSVRSDHESLTIFGEERGFATSVCLACAYKGVEGATECRTCSPATCSCRDDILCAPSRRHGSPEIGSPGRSRAHLAPTCRP